MNNKQYRTIYLFLIVMSLFLFLLNVTGYFLIVNHNRILEINELVSLIFVLFSIIIYVLMLYLHARN